MQLLPALVENDLASFGPALSEIQRITGGWFAAQQGGIFAPGPTEGLIAKMASLGAAGVGQSSWGPAAYGLIEGESAAKSLAQQIRGVIGSGGTVFEGTFSPVGARTWPSGEGVMH
jgi:predicted sugar kinase